MKNPKYKQKCWVQDCSRLVGSHGGHGLCNAHYKRWRVDKSMIPPIQDRGAGWVSSHGYHYVGNRAQHRIIMEEKLGRRLGFNEIVHHKDGDIKNNNPNNLMVMDRGEHIRLHTKGKSNKQRKEEKEQYGYCLAGKPV